MTETTADDLRTMTPDVLRRWLAEALDYRIYEGEGYYGRFVCMIPPSHDYTPEEWAKFWRMTRAYPTAEKAWTGEDVPDWPNDIGAALALCLEIADSHDDWQIRMTTTIHANGHKIVLADFYEWEGDLGGHYVDAIVASGETPALALSRLAALALLERG